MPPHSKIRAVSIQGVGAVLHPQKFDFSNQDNLIVFAPNGMGKSSLVNGFEFALSRDSKVSTLGQLLGVRNESTNLDSLEHVLAKDYNCESSVALKFELNNKNYEITWNKNKAVIGNSTATKAYEDLKSKINISSFVRGNELRVFSEDYSSEYRYSRLIDLVGREEENFLQESFVVFNSIKERKEHIQREIEKLESDIKSDFGESLVTWEESDFIRFINEITLKPLDSGVVVKSLDISDSGVQKLIRLASIEFRTKQLENYQSIQNILSQLSSNSSDTKKHSTDAISTYNAQIKELSKIKKKLTETSYPNESQEITDRFIDPILNRALDGSAICPICEKSFNPSIDDIDILTHHSQFHPHEFRNYSKLKHEELEKSHQANKTKFKIVSELGKLIGYLNQSRISLNDPVRTTIKSIEMAVKNRSIILISDINELKKYMIETKKFVKNIEDPENIDKFKIFAKKVSDLIGFWDKYYLLRGEISQIEPIENFTFITVNNIKSRINIRVQTFLNNLENLMNELYQEIQGSKKYNFRLKLNYDEKTGKHHVVIKFKFKKLRNVEPGGYLNDAQLHTLALAFKLASIIKLNPEFPIVILDDIATSYDVDNRYRLAKLIATNFNGRFSQVILFTHNERLFRYLMEQTRKENYQFLEIIRLDEDGPIFTEGLTKIEQIKWFIANRKPAGNLIRQYMEDWLQMKLKDFGIKVPFSKKRFDRAEAAGILINFLLQSKIFIKSDKVIKLLKNFEIAELENFESHSAETEQGDWSTGDNEARWEEVMDLNASLTCNMCKYTTFTKRIRNRENQCSKCQKKFNFSGIV